MKEKRMKSEKTSTAKKNALLVKRFFPYLKKHLGKMGEMLYAYANGRDNSPVISVNEQAQQKSLGKGLLMVLECIGYLFYCIFFVWLFVDITDNLKRNKTTKKALEIF